MTNFEVANIEKPEEIIMAAQKSVIKAIQKVVAEVKAETKNPGLTWEQIDYLLEGFKNKQPKIITQEYPT